MKRRWMVILIGFFLMLPVASHAQLDKLLEGLFGGSGEGVRPEQVTVIHLEFLPDPVPEGQRPAFRAVVENASQYSVRTHLGIVQRDQIVSSVRNIVLRPGDNQIDFPEMSQGLSGQEPCFTMDAIVDRTRMRINTAREFCAKKARAGWTLSDRGIAREAAGLHIQDMDMYPEPATPGQELRFTVTLRNDGRPARGHMLLQDRDQVIARIENASIPRGSTEYRFTRSRYAFQRPDNCLKVAVEIDGTVYAVDALGKAYCVRPTGWTLKPLAREPRERRGEQER